MKKLSTTELKALARQITTRINEVVSIEKQKIEEKVTQDMTLILFKQQLYELTFAFDPANNMNIKNLINSFRFRLSTPLEEASTVLAIYNDKTKGCNKWNNGGLEDKILNSLIVQNISTEELGSSIDSFITNFVNKFFEK